MNIIQITPSSGPAPDPNQLQFAYPHKGASTIFKATRIQNLVRALAEDPSKELAQISAAWEQAQKLHSDQNKFIETLQKGLGDQVWSVYKKEFESDSVDNLFQKFLKDVYRTSAFSLRKSHSGVRGPTFFVAIPKTNRRLKTCVIKNSDRGEIAAKLLYDAFSKFSFEQPRCCGFSVPVSANFDFVSHTYQAANGVISEIPEKLSSDVQKSLSDMVNTYDPNLNSKFEHVLLLEKISGQNLLDFAFSGYETLDNSQRKKLFERLGRLAFLDLLTGNYDRLIRWMDEPKYELFEMEANLGNIMVHVADNKRNFHLYAIDNGSDAPLILDKNAKKLFNQFLQEQLTKNDPYKDLIENITSCFEEKFNIELSEMGREKRLEAAEKLKSIRKDLREIAPDALRLGLSKMADWIAFEILPKKWDTSPEAINLKKSLKEVYPEYLESIEERFKIFKTIRSK